MGTIFAVTLSRSYAIHYHELKLCIEMLSLSLRTVVLNRRKTMASGKMHPKNNLIIIAPKCSSTSIGRMLSTS